MDNKQMAELTLKLLATAQVPFADLQAGVAVHNWLTSFTTDDVPPKK